ncbi:DJ-1/PfpI family protein [Streptomyces sulphureus]|uniref:DJ-1/PfpI family protein n=1 Tax=Streptomyces sulphureus TaxID=47758 RepID=UPI00035FC216|nr:DJ-1/PfpI family protein [Streptomyces sulphureus]
MRIVLPVFDGFTALDVIGPYEVLRMLPDAEVLLVSYERGEVSDGAGAVRLVVQAAFAEVERADVLLVPGGPGARRRTEEPELLDWLRRLHTSTDWTASVCTGALLLAAAGVLDGLRATTHWSAAALLESFGATYAPERVVTEGRILTGAGVSAGIDLALTLAERVAGRTAAEAYQLALEYDPQPPFTAGSLDTAPQGAKDYLAARAAR